MKNWIKEIFQDVDGGFSSKRTITIAAFILVAIAFIANLFFDLHILEFIYNSMMYIVMTGMGLTVPEFISNKLKKPVKQETEE